MFKTEADEYLSKDQCITGILEWGLEDGLAHYVRHNAAGQINRNDVVLELFVLLDRMVMLNRASFIEKLNDLSLITKIEKAFDDLVLFIHDLVERAKDDTGAYLSHLFEELFIQEESAPNTLLGGISSLPHKAFLELKQKLGIE